MTAGRGEERALIVGGGVGGLSLAIGLARRGHDATVLERGSFTDRSGAGIQLGANAVRRLGKLGVLDVIEPAAFRPEALWIFDAVSGKRLTALTLGAPYEARFGAPYLSLHRADLHGGLYDVCQSFNAVELRSDFELVEISDDGSSVSAKSLKGEAVSAPYLIGADGLWSTVRRLIGPGTSLAFTHQTASRALLSTTDLDSPFDAPVVGLWLGNKTHLVTYPVRAGTELNVVLVTEGGARHQGWNDKADPRALLQQTQHWAAAPQCLLQSATDWRDWSLYRLQPLPRWSRGNVALLGDAAHPVLPFLAQGAALAIEDADTLAETLMSCGRDHRPAFAEYEGLRRRRASRVQRQSARLGKLYHLPAPWSLARNLVLARRHPMAALAALDWLYGG